MNLETCDTTWSKHHVAACNTTEVSLCEKNIKSLFLKSLKVHKPSANAHTNMSESMEETNLSNLALLFHSQKALHSPSHQPAEIHTTISHPNPLQVSEFLQPLP
jgi:hypothetical protein